MKEFFSKLGFENYVIFMAILVLLIGIMYMWYEITKCHAITGDRAGFVLAGFISFLVVILIGMWIKNVREEFKNKINN